LQNPAAKAVVDSLVNLIASPLWSESTSSSSITAALGQFQTDTMTAFNAQWVNAPGVQYFSVAGRSSLLLAETECESARVDRPTFVSDFDGTRDPLTSLLSTTALVISPNAFSLVPNDGLVPVESAKWGTFLGCVPADHLDEIGQIGGFPPGLGNDWRHKPFYVDVVKFLRSRGL
jgi:triacylglycerol esterase/lipase EstA (alpha/beta hydrolase family)